MPDPTPPLSGSGADHGPAPARPEAFHRTLELERRVREYLSYRASRDTNALVQERLSLGARAADRLAAVAGSWRFIGGFVAFLLVWIAVNAGMAALRWDPYPFILLNLMLSCLAAIQAPVIMMSQTRQETRDRVRGENDYAVNLKSEVLLEHLTAEVEELKALVRALGGDGPHGAGEVRNAPTP